MGGAECGRRWTQRLCVLLVMFVVLVYTITIRDKISDQRNGRQMPAEGQNFSQSSWYQSLVAPKLLTLDKAAPMDSHITPWEGVNKLTGDTSLPSTSQNRVPVYITGTTSPVESVSPSTNVSATGQKLTPPTEMLPPKLRSRFIPLVSSELTGLKTLVLFVGFARSGHSIVGSLLDAHPDIIISHEYSILKDVKRSLGRSRGALLALVNRLYRNSHESAVSGWRSRRKGQKGYNLGMSRGSWQGRVRSLRVVGDKAAAKTAWEHQHDHTKCLQLTHLMNATLGVAVKAIRVLRNPYDVISTRVLYNTMTVSEIASARNSSRPAKYKRPTVLDKQTERFLELTSQVNRIITQCHLRVHDVHLADLVHQPRRVMRELCDSLQVECYSDYLDLCEEKVFKSLSKTRYLVEWSQEQRETVARRMRSYPEFSRYSYDCDC